MVYIFRDALAAILEAHLPSRHAFFTQLANCSSTDLSAAVLNELYTRYQAAMHATRVMAYFIPHLDNIELRMLKFQVLADDDGAPNGDSHHFQLRRTWATMLGHDPATSDDQFGSLDALATRLDFRTARFVAAAKRLYPMSLGPWLVTESLAHDWIGALLRALQPHFAEIDKSDYFVANYSSSVEITHAATALTCVERVLATEPHLLDETLQGAVAFADEFDGLWAALSDALPLALGSMPSDSQ